MCGELGEDSVGTEETDEVIIADITGLGENSGKTEDTDEVTIADITGPGEDSDKTEDTDEVTIADITGLLPILIVEETVAIADVGVTMLTTGESVILTTGI